MDSENIITTCLVRIYISNLIVDPRFCFRYATCSVAHSRSGDGLYFLSGG